MEGVATEGKRSVMVPGEATELSSLHRSTVRGAWISAIRAAEGVSRALGISVSLPGAEFYSPSSENSEIMEVFVREKVEKKNERACVMS